MKLELIIEQIKGLDVLAFPLLAGVEVLSMKGRTKKQAIDYLKEKEITIGFSRHSSSIEKAYLESCKEGSNEKFNPRNFTLYLDIKNAETTPHHSHFHWNGSYEGLDMQLQKEIRILREFGFNINYHGYLKERDISI